MRGRRGADGEITDVNADAGMQEKVSVHELFLLSTPEMKTNHGEKQKKRQGITEQSYRNKTYRCNEKIDKAKVGTCKHQGNEQMFCGVNREQGAEAHSNRSTRDPRPETREATKSGERSAQLHGARTFNGSRQLRTT